MRGIREEREMREAARYEEAAEVECPARRLLERADATLAEDHVLAARVEQVLGRGEPLLDGRSEPAFQKDGAGASARFLQEVVVLAVPRADLQHVGPLSHRDDLRGRHHFRHDGESRRISRILQPAESFETMPLERIGERARLEDCLLYT